MGAPPTINNAPGSCPVDSGQSHLSHCLYMTNCKGPNYNRLSSAMKMDCQRPDYLMLAQPPLYTSIFSHSGTYDHTHWRIRDPVRSPIVKPVRAGLVVGSVTTSEYLVLYVFCGFFLPSFPAPPSPLRSLAQVMFEL